MVARIFLNDVLELLGSNKMSYESYTALFIKTWGRESYNHPKKSEEILKAICTYPKFQVYNLFHILSIKTWFVRFSIGIALTLANYILHDFTSNAQIQA